VEATPSTARPIERFVSVQADARSLREAAVRSRFEGYVERVATDEGAVVARGDLLLALDPGELESQIREAEARLEQAREDFAAGARLREREVLSAQALNARRTALEAARAEVARLERRLGDAAIHAPFGGVIERLDAEPGTFVRVGEEVAELVDLSVLEVEARVSQQEIAQIARGAAAQVAFASGETAAGRVCFISRRAEPGTRTFRVVIRVPNPGAAIPAGVSAEARIPTETIRAHLLSPAALSLDEQGRLGLKTVDAAGGVRFRPVRIVRSGAGGVWVSGLPERARIVTRGQGFVRDGDVVRVAPAQPNGGMAEAPPASPAETDAAPGLSICGRDAHGDADGDGVRG
jgi:multidrug efflux system membrane fusion protein